MARLWCSGLETGSSSVFNITPGGGAQTTAGGNALGSWSSYCAQGGSGGMKFSFTSTSELYFGMRWLTTNNASTGRLLNFYSPNGTDNVALRYTAANKLEFSRNDGTTVLATGTTVLGPNVLYYIEVYTLINDATGKYQVRLNGVDEIALVTGVDTRNDAAANGDKIDRINICADFGTHYVDDIYVNDTTTTANNGFSGDIQVSAQYGIPNADGSNSGMTLSTGVSHFGVVDERPPNTTDYAFGTGTTEVDTLNVPNTSGIASVQSVTLWLYAAKSDAGAGNIATVLKSGATTDTGTDQALSTTYAYYSKVFNQDPNGTINWTAAAVDAMEIGAKSR